MKTYLIIGGSSGIGKAIVNALVSDNRILNISRSLPDYSHSNLTNFAVDVLHDELPVIDTVDGVVYCPGSINLKPFSRFSLDEFREDFEINVLGAVRVLQKYLQPLKQSENAAVVLFSTVATKLGMPFHASVAASKSAIEGLTKSLAAEYATNIRFNAIAPTVTNTPLAEKLLRNEKMIENMKQRHPYKKYLQPSGVAKLAKYLLSEDASSMSGQIFPIDAGIVSVKV